MFKSLKRLLKFFSGKGSSRVRRGSLNIDREMVANRWSEIDTLMKTGGASRLRSAVVEADKLLDYALRGRGFQGETMGERLKMARGKISNSAYESAWQAHKLRNRLVHEIDADVLHFEVKKAIDNFHHVLRELGVL